MTTPKKPPKYNRVLLNVAPFRSIPGRGFLLDGSPLPFIMEELVALSAYEIIVPRNSATAIWVENLDSVLKRCVHVFDESHVLQQVEAVFNPIAKEFDLEFTRNTIKYHRSIPEDLSIAIHTLLCSLEPFISGISFQAEVDLDARRFKAAVRRVRDASRDHHVRAFLAYLEGILNTYTTIDTPSLVMTPTARTEAIRTFELLIADELYEHLTIEARGFGLLHRLGHSLARCKDLAARIISSRRLKPLVNLSSKAITAATKVPTPGTDALVSLIGSGYLPPFVSIKEAVQRGIEKCEESDVALSDWDEVEGQLRPKKV